jgi:NAD(P)-dependent dehydrogenase (short-subunit alcohol dehydrogenase family)
MSSCVTTSEIVLRSQATEGEAGVGKLDGKTIVVTGAARGIGTAIATLCAEEGARLLVVDVDPAVERVAEGIDAVAVVGDLTEDGLAERVVAQATEQLGGLDGLVNNAALVLEGDILATDTEAWRRTMALNVEAPFRWSQAAIPAMLAHGGGSIVNISSTEGIVARPDHFAYVTSKAALAGLTRSIAIDFGRHEIRCNAISPGSIESEKFREYVAENPGLEEELISYNYRGRIGRPREVAACCVYLLSDDSGFVNGADYVIDGGRTAGS